MTSISILVPTYRTTHPPTPSSLSPSPSLPLLNFNSVLSHYSVHIQMVTHFSIWFSLSLSLSLSLSPFLPHAPTSPLLLWLYVPPLPPAVVWSPPHLPPRTRQVTKSWDSFVCSLSQREGRGLGPCTHSPPTWKPFPAADHSWRRRVCEECS